MSVRIESDFVDFYDNESDYKADIVYNRFYSQSLGKVKELRRLNRIGVKTLEIEPVSHKTYSKRELVVYSDTRKHLGKGKRIMRYEEARLIYNNSLSSEYYEESSENVFKFLQIGERRFRLMLKYKPRNLEEFTVESIEEAGKEFNSSIALPIYSIDYLNIDNRMIAIDFNMIEKLDRLNMQSIISSEEVVEEIEKTIRHYNG